MILRALAIAMSTLLPLPGSAAQSVLEFQPFSQTQNMRLPVGDVTLVNLNKGVNGWYLLTVDMKDGQTCKPINIQNPYPKTQQLVLSADFPGGLLIRDVVKGTATPCGLWSSGSESIFRDGQIVSEAASVPFYSICGGTLFIRSQQNGNQSTIEWGSSMARSWGGEWGEWIVNETKTKILQDHFIQTAVADTASTDPDTSVDLLGTADLSAEYKGMVINGNGLGIAVAPGTALRAGEWYAAKNHSGVFVSTMAPKMISNTILQSYLDRVNRLDNVEVNASVYLVAFDLGQFEMGWGNGTNLPGVEWSAMTAKLPRDNPFGPDGFNSLKPLTFPGAVDPVSARRAEATFCGGWKRQHAAFRHGPFSTINHGSHYGFMENGVLMSTINTGLATMISYADGKFDIKSWDDQDAAKLSQMKDVRQGGAALIESRGVPGPLVSSWGGGNWSGTVEGNLRAPRAAGCIIQRDPQHRFFVYGYFTSATPSAVARVFQAYGCDYSMHLDMNSPGQSYLALFDVTKPDMAIEHLSKDMAGNDPTSKGPGGRSMKFPRFLANPDYRDFFYLMRKL